jgi:hypothetical protein
MICNLISENKILREESLQLGHELVSSRDHSAEQLGTESETIETKLNLVVGCFQSEVEE